jgi:hypothetical protein
LSEGIVGIAFRHRDMFTPLFLILAAHSINVNFCRTRAL